MTSRSRQAAPSGIPAATREYEYPIAEKLAVSESPEQSVAIDVLFHSLKVLARRRGWSQMQVWSHLFIAWKRDDPRARIAPDVFLLSEPLRKGTVSWQTWMPGQSPPRWAAEIVSSNWAKDYRRAPDNYAQLGCAELVLFDPAAASGETSNQARAPLSIYRRFADGAFRHTYAGPGPAYSDELGCWLLSGNEGYWKVLRLSEDAEGQRLVPTDTEDERTRAEAEKQRADAALQRAEAEVAARTAAEARIRELEATRKSEKDEHND